MSYFIFNKIHFTNGDVGSVPNITGFETAVNVAKGYINGDSGKCAVIRDISNGSFEVWFKLLAKTNPSAADANSHNDHHTILFAKTI